MLPSVERTRLVSLVCKNYPLFPYEVSPDDFFATLRLYSLLVSLYGDSVVQVVLGQGAQALFKHPRRDLVAPSEISTGIYEKGLPKALKKVGNIQGEKARPLTVQEIEELIEGIVQASKIMGIQVHEHLIISMQDDNYYSFADHGIIKKIYDEMN